MQKQIIGGLAAIVLTSSVYAQQNTIDTKNPPQQKSAQRHNTPNVPIIQASAVIISAILGALVRKYNNNNQHYGTVVPEPVNPYSHEEIQR